MTATRGKRRRREDTVATSTSIRKVEGTENQ